MRNQRSTEVKRGGRQSKKEKEDNHQINTVSNKDTSKQDVNSGAAIAQTSSLLPSPSMISQPKIDATDRRQIEAQNEDKSHATKEELDDIKRTHYEEKQKKEQAIIEPFQSGVNNDRWVSKPLLYNLYFPSSLFAGD